MDQKKSLVMLDCDRSQRIGRLSVGRLKIHRGQPHGGSSSPLGTKISPDNIPISSGRGLRPLASHQLSRECFSTVTVP
jgi:hypothetical protein